MLKDDKVYLIDFQGGRRGALQYDLASLLYESKVNLSATLREKIFNYYLEVYSGYNFFDREEFQKFFPAYALVRILQAFGAYGYRGIFEKKAFFAKSIALGLSNLLELFNEPVLSKNFPYLYSIVKSMQGLNSKFNIPIAKEGLYVTITSFSYKNGLPDDWSGNGGGFVFDCRALPNPGRYEQYRSLTGRDNDVIDFLKKEHEVNVFLSSTQEVVASSVKKYIERGFSNLSISFGCTGGQHRSVYSAQNLFNFLKMNFDVKLRLIHREQNIDEFYDKDNVQEKSEEKGGSTK